jgi:GDP-4-dehydro-6-deoxy-D-mannose reductase
LRHQAHERSSLGPCTRSQLVVTWSALAVTDSTLRCLNTTRLLNPVAAGTSPSMRCRSRPALWRQAYESHRTWRGVRVLVTGGLGFIGRWLGPHLSAQGHEVWLTYHRASHHAEVPGCRSVGLDVRDAEAVEDCVRAVQPERVYHLAAQSLPTVSWKDPALTMEVNVLGTVHLFEGLRKAGQRARVLVACSSAEYGFVAPHEVPTKEDQPLRPLHPYGVSKVAQDLLAYQEHRNHSTHAVRVRIFNTTGPGKTNDAASDFTRRAVEIELGLREPVLRVGNLEPRRGFCDVRDMVRALELALERGQPGEVYNAGASEAIRMQDVLDQVLALSTAKPRVEVDKALLRPTDEPIILGDSGKLRAATGWALQVPLRTTLHDMMAHWRGALRRGGA